MSSNNYRFRGINLTSSVVTNLSNVVGTTVTAALNTLNAALGAITSDMVQNLSGVVGATVTAALNTLNTLKATLASPTFTGIPAAPTAASGTNTTQIATTAFVTEASGRGLAHAEIGVVAIPNTAVAITIASVPFTTSANTPDVEVCFTTTAATDAFGFIVVDYELRIDGVVVPGSQSSNGIGGFGGGTVYMAISIHGVTEALAAGAHTATFTVTSSAGLGGGEFFNTTPTGSLTVRQW